MSQINRSLRRKGASVGLSAVALFAAVLSIAPAANAMTASAGPVSVSAPDLTLNPGLPLDVQGLAGTATDVAKSSMATVGGVANATGVGFDLPTVIR